MGLPPEKCWELYDLKADPHELENRYDDPKYNQAVAALKRRLDALRKELNDTADPLKAPEQPGDKKRTRKDGMKEQRA